MNEVEKVTKVRKGWSDISGRHPCAGRRSGRWFKRYFNRVIRRILKRDVDSDN